MFIFSVFSNQFVLTWLLLPPLLKDDVGIKVIGSFSNDLSITFLKLYYKSEFLLKVLMKVLTILFTFSSLISFSSSSIW